MCIRDRIGNLLDAPKRTLEVVIDWQLAALAQVQGSHIMAGFQSSNEIPHDPRATVDGVMPRGERKEKEKSSPQRSPPGFGSVVRRCSTGTIDPHPVSYTHLRA